jgi:hypothetical protein
MRSLKWRGVAAAAVIAAGLGLAAVNAGPASGVSQPIDLGPIGFGSIAVDSAHGHVFVSGPTANVVDVFDETGSLVKSFSSEDGATGMVIVGSTLYVALTTAGAIERIDLPSLSDQGPLVSGLVAPKWLAFADGQLWTAADGRAADITQLESITLEGTVTTFPSSASFYEPDLATSPALPNTLFVAEDGLSSGPIHRVDVTTGTPVVTATAPYYGQGYIYQLVVSPDGTRVIAATGAGVDEDLIELSAATLQPDGIPYPGGEFPSAVAVSPGDGGLLATGLDNSYSSPDVEVHVLGNTAQVLAGVTNTPEGFANVAPHGLAMTDDGSRLYVITASTGYEPEVTLQVFTITIVPRTPLGWLPPAVPYPASNPWFLSGESGSTGATRGSGPGADRAAAVNRSSTSVGGSCGSPGACGSDPGIGPAGSVTATPSFTG